jgi:uncharacterized paraquat-inducible protein A
MEEEKIEKIKCNECEYEWDYKGISVKYAQCPKCRKNVLLDKNKKEVEHD